MRLNHGTAKCQVTEMLANRSQKDPRRKENFYREKKTQIPREPKLTMTNLSWNNPCFTFIAKIVLSPLAHTLRMNPLDIISPYVVP
jgi:hypothetical protein